MVRVIAPGERREQKPITKAWRLGETSKGSSLNVRLNEMAPSVKPFVGFPVDANRHRKVLVGPVSCQWRNNYRLRKPA